MNPNPECNPLSSWAVESLSVCHPSSITRHGLATSLGFDHKIGPRPAAKSYDCSFLVSEFRIRAEHHARTYSFGRVPIIGKHRMATHVSECVGFRRGVRT